MGLCVCVVDGVAVKMMLVSRRGIYAQQSDRLEMTNSPKCPAAFQLKHSPISVICAQPLPTPHQLHQPAKK